MSTGRVDQTSPRVLISATKLGLYKKSLPPELPSPSASRSPHTSPASLSPMSCTRRVRSCTRGRHATATAAAAAAGEAASPVWGKAASPEGRCSWALR